MVEYAFAVSTLNSPHNLAIGAFIGTVSGFSVTQLAFTSELIGSIGSNTTLAEIVRQAKTKIGVDVIQRFATDFLGAGAGLSGLGGLEGLGSAALTCFGGAVGNAGWGLLFLQHQVKRPLIGRC